MIVTPQSSPHALEIPEALDLPVGPYPGRPEDPATGVPSMFDSLRVRVPDPT
jgi:hypothetical protein